MSGINSGVFGASAPVQQSGSGFNGIIIENVPCHPTVFVNAAVRMSTGTAFNALADSLANSNVIGFVIAKISSEVCNVRISGLTEAVFSGLDDTKEYFLSDTVAGEITTTIPTTSGHVVYRLGIPFSATQFAIDKAARFVRA